MEPLNYKQLCNIIKAYELNYKDWVSNSDKIYKIYENQKDKKGCKKYPTLYSNIETLHPAFFSKSPTPEIVKRKGIQFGEYDNHVVTLVGQICNFYVDESNFFDAVDKAVLDRLLVGRGVVWVSYQPEFAQAQDATGITFDHLSDEKICFDYVHYADFGHNIARSWEGVKQVWRKTRQSRQDILDQFPEANIDAIQFHSVMQGNEDNDNQDHTNSDDVNSVCEMYEIWCKVTKSVYYVIKDYQDKSQFSDEGGLLGVKNVNNQFSDFFPCPVPLYGKTKNKTLIPIPDYHFYQDQAEELDKTTDNFYQMIDMIKVKGVYDASIESIGLMFETDNTLTSVSSWKMLAEKGGLSGVIDFFDFKTAADAAMLLLQARNQQKQDLMDITGISDVVRGSSNPNETATAQGIKGKYVGMRLSKPQRKVENFCRDIIVLIAEIVVNNFTVETINKIIDIPGLSEQDELLVINQLKQTSIDYYRINIETNSTIQPDAQYEQSTRMEAISGIGNFLMQAVQAPPQIMPLVGEMLKFVVSSYPAAKSLEQVVDQTIEEVVSKSQNPTPPPPDPEIEKEKIKIQADMQIEQLKSQTDLQIAQLKGQNDLQKEQMKINAEIRKEQLKSEEAYYNTQQQQVINGYV